MTLSDTHVPHLIAVLWFILCWVGYTRYADWRGRDTACLASVMHLYRQDWMQRLLLRENRIADANVIGNLERNASFFASSTLIILAGILTALGASDRAVSLLADLPFAQPVSRGLSEIKLLCLAVVFVYAFFTFSWCMRQYNFAAVLVASAPMVGSVTSAIRSAELSPIGLHGSSPWRPTSSTSACAPTISAWRRWPGLSIHGSSCLSPLAWCSSSIAGSFIPTCSR